MAAVRLFAIASLLVCINAMALSPIHGNVRQPESHLSMLDLSARMETMEEMTDLVAPSEEPVAITTSSEKRVAFAFRNSTVGFIRASNVGVSVTAGASATLNFAITLEALRADALAEDDKEFRDVLTNEEEEEAYKKLKADYAGGLNIPYLESIGANLEHNVTRRDLRAAARIQDNYNSKAIVARKLLTAMAPERVTVSGSITVQGNSFIPRTYFPFVKAAQVHLNDGSRILVVSTKAVDSEAATADGLATTSSADSLVVEEEVA